MLTFPNVPYFDTIMLVSGDAFYLIFSYLVLKYITRNSENKKEKFLNLNENITRNTIEVIELERERLKVY